MVKLLTLLFALSFFGSAKVEFVDVPHNAVNDDQGSEVTRPKDDGVPLPTPNPARVARERRDPNYRPVGLGTGADSACQEGYLSRKGGKYGTRGKILIEEILSSPMKDYFMGSVTGLDKVCPKFKDFNADQKLNFWVAFFAHLGDFESDCRHWLYVSCTNGKCGGDFQMPVATSHRTWRIPKEFKKEYKGKGCNGSTGNGQGGHWVTGQRNNISCAVQIMAGQMCGFYKTNYGHCAGKTSPLGRGYWQPINEGRLNSRLKAFPLCGGGKK